MNRLERSRVVPAVSSTAWPTTAARTEPAPFSSQVFATHLYRILHVCPMLETS